MARDAIGLLDVLKVERAHVFGLSLGGMVASWIAIDAPERIARLVLGSTLPEPGAISHRILRHGSALVRAFLSVGDEVEVRLLLQILSPQFRHAHPGRVRAIVHTIRTVPSKRGNLIALAAAAALHHAEPQLRGVRIPTLLLVGALDEIARRRSQLELLHDLPTSRLEILPNAGHDISLEQPIEAADHIISFLREQRPAEQP